MQYQIEPNLPIPVPRGALLPPCEFPYASMKVGDSFLVPATNGERYRRQIDASNAARDWRKRTRKTTFKITTRQTPEGVRVWRIA